MEKEINNQSGQKTEEEREAEEARRKKNDAEEWEMIFLFQNFVLDQLEISQTKAREAAMDKVLRHLREMFDATGQPPQSARLREFLGYNNQKEQKER